MENPLFNKFKEYFFKSWKKHSESGSLNYIYIDKKQRSNSYIENYNRRIREILGPYVTKRGRSIIPWPLFLIFLYNEEINFRNIITECLTNEPSYNEKKELNFVDTIEYNPGDLGKKMKNIGLNMIRIVVDMIQ